MREIRVGSNHVALVDDEDFDLVSRYTWKPKRKPTVTYAEAVVDGRYTRLHRLILGANAWEQVDHRDGNALNCQKSNLRIATPQENARNRRIMRTNTSTFKGVVRRERKGTVRYLAYAYVDGKTKNLGSFLDPESAAQCYDDHIRANHGEFGRYNFPQNDEQPANTS